MPRVGGKGGVALKKVIYAHRLFVYFVSSYGRFKVSHFWFVFEVVMVAPDTARECAGEGGAEGGREGRGGVDESYIFFRNK